MNIILTEVVTLLEEGKSILDIGKLYNLKNADVIQYIEVHNLVDKVLNRAYWKWTPEEDAQLLNEVEEGLSHLEIAEIHRRTKSAITKRVEFLTGNKNSTTVKITSGKGIITIVVPKDTDYHIQLV